MPKAVIVGAGINGLCTAHALVRRGWAVEVLEAQPGPGVLAASFDRHRLIRDHYPTRRQAARDMARAFAAWEALWRDLGTAPLATTGVVSLSRAEGDGADLCRALFAELGVAHAVVAGEEVARRLPHLDPGGVRFAVLTARGGALLADRILAALAGALARAGAPVAWGVPALSVDPVAGRVTTPGGVREGDVVLLAAGIGTAALCPLPLPPLEPRRCVVVYAAPPADLAPLWAGAPCWSGLGAGDELWGMPGAAGAAPKFGAGDWTVPGDPGREREARAADTGAILAAYRGRVRGIERFRPVRTVANFYLMAPGERFLLAHADRLAVLTADSGHGFKFGALTGAEVAAALDGGDMAAAAAALGAR